MQKPMTTAAVLILTLAVGGWTQVSPSANVRGGFYSQQQATRGRQLFANACANCHTADSAKPAEEDLPLRLPIALTGDRFMQKWRTLGDLYSKVSTSMPIDSKIGVLGLQPVEYREIVAYLLQANGFKPGNELGPDVSAMKNLVLRPIPSQRASQAEQPAAVVNQDAYYTEEQANRGRAYFYGACSTCHIASASGATPADIVAGRGYKNGNGVRLLNVVSDRFVERWRNVGSLFNKIRLTMPGHDAGGLSRETYVDIAAYILQANGVPAGNEELKDDATAMKSLTLVEKGFTKLFNGKDFAGLKFMIGPGCLPKPSGCASTDPGSTFRIENGTIINSGKPYGYMYTDKTYWNFTLRLEYKFLPHEGMASDDDDFFGNSGYLLFITKHQVWPPYLEIQGGHSSVLSVIATGGKATFTVDADARRRVMKPVGQWNSVEIISENGQVRSSLNGTLISTVTEHGYKTGHIGFQSEGSEIHWRNLRIKTD